RGGRAGDRRDPGSRAGSRRRPVRGPSDRLLMRLRAFILTALAACVLAGVAAADTTVGFVTGGQSALPSASAPNASGSIVVPFDLSAPPAVPEQRSYPQLVELWRGAGRQYGVPWSVLGAINKIESNFGQNMGPSSAGAVG